MCPWVYGHPLGCEQPTNSHIPRDRCSLFLENLELPRSFHHWPTPQLSSHTRIITLSSPCSQEEAQGADLFNDQVTIARPLWPWEHGRGGSYLSMWLLNPRCELFVQWITRRSTMNKNGQIPDFQVIDFKDAQRLPGDLPELSFCKERFLGSEEMVLV